MQPFTHRSLLSNAPFQNTPPFRCSCREASSHRLVCRRVVESIIDSALELLDEYDDDDDDGNSNGGGESWHGASGVTGQP